MKRIRIILSVLAVCFLFSGCASLRDTIKENVKTTFEVPGYGLELTANVDFEECIDKGGWDVQITDGISYLGVMAYKYIDLAEAQTPKSIYDYHNEDLFSRRENVSVIESETTVTETDRSVTKTLYSAESDGTKNYYASYLIDFEEAETFAWILITALPSYYEETEDMWNSIIESIKVIEETDS